MARLLVAGGLLGVGVGCAASYVYFQRQQPERGPEDEGVQELARHPALKHGMPVSDSLRAFAGYVVAWDTRLRNPKWVIEHLTRQSTSGGGSRKTSQFREDSGIDARFRSKLQDYRGSGYDRGHLASAANHKSSQRAMDDTFVLSNTSPQVGAGFNRDYWARFEQFVRDLSKRCTDGVYVVSGPLYLPRRSASGWTLEHPMLGTPPQLMAVPTHYFKVVLGEVEATSEVAVGAWVMPNSAIAPDVPLTAFTVPLSALEEVSGLRFFPAYMSETRRQYVDRAALALQHAGRAQLGPGGAHPNVLLLPGGPSAASAASSARPSASGPSAGIIHVCEHTACRLPAEKFWLEDRRPRRKELPEGAGNPRR